MIHEIPHVVCIQRGLFQKVFDREEGVVEFRRIVVDVKVRSCLDFMNPFFMSIMQFLQILK